MKNNVDFPEFKDCGCGARIRVIYAENLRFADVYIGFASCACGESHFSLIGDGVDVRAAAKDLEDSLAASGAPITERKFSNLSRH